MLGEIAAVPYFAMVDLSRLNSFASAIWLRPASFLNSFNLCEKIFIILPLFTLHSDTKSAKLHKNWLSVSIKEMYEKKLLAIKQEIKVLCKNYDALDFLPYIFVFVAR